MASVISQHIYTREHLLYVYNSSSQNYGQSKMQLKTATNFKPLPVTEF